MLVPLRDHSSVAPSMRNATATNISTHVITGPTRNVAPIASAAATNGSHILRVPRTRHTVTMDLTLVNLDSPDEVRTFDKGRFELYRIGPMTLGRATYEPGWRWSEHVGAASGERSCQVEHIGLVLSGRAMAAMDDGTEKVMSAGDFFYVPPGHDSWVVGDEPYVSLHIMGSEGYAA